MHSYYEKLHVLKGFLVVGESVILILRLIFQVLFTLPSALLVMQVLMAAIIYSRRHCQPEAQVTFSLCSYTFSLTFFSSIAWAITSSSSISTSTLPPLP
jgi:hypothetical protein